MSRAHIRSRVEGHSSQQHSLATPPTIGRGSSCTRHIASLLWHFPHWIAVSYLLPSAENFCIPSAGHRLVIQCLLSDFPSEKALREKSSDTLRGEEQEAHLSRVG